MSDYLPLEVIEEILYRVPVQSLVRLRCVCKSWCSLISCPEFISTKANNGQKLLLFRYLSPTTRTDDYVLRFDNATFDKYASFKCPFQSRLLNLRVVGTCNGLVCLCDDPYVPDDNLVETFTLWNPAIRKFVKLPHPSIDLPMAAIGFGFDSKRNDFKVVRLACERVIGIATAPLVEVYSVRSGSWRTIANGWDPSYGIVESFWSQVFLNGSVHWLGYKSADHRKRGLSFAMDLADRCFRLKAYRSCPAHGFCNVVLSLDLADEEFRMIEVPLVLADMFPLNFSLGLCRDSLALFVYDNRLNCQKFDVFVMKEYGVVESWSCLFSVEAKEIIRTIFGFTDGGDVLVAAADNKIHSYSHKEGCTIIGNVGVKGSLYAGSFVETLGLLDEEVNKGLSGLLKSDEAAASETDGEEENKLEEEFLQKRFHLRIAAWLVGVDIF